MIGNWGFNIRGGGRVIGEGGERRKVRIVMSNGENIKFKSGKRKEEEEDEEREVFEGFRFIIVGDLDELGLISVRLWGRNVRLLFFNWRGREGFWEEGLSWGRWGVIEIGRFVGFFISSYF